MTRFPAVAGTFYPADKETLITTINGMFHNVTKKEALDELIGLVSPHAGYPYAGQTQAHGFYHLRENTSRVILLGPSHYYPIDYIAVYPEGSWQTPLGEVKIDESLAEVLLNESKYFKPDVEPHTPEHSLEVIVPWLQVKLKEFKILPMLVGQLDISELEEAGEHLAQLLHKIDDYIIVASSDLYHGYSYQEGINMDNRTIEQIISGDYRRFMEDMRTGRIMACGAYAVALLMVVMNKLGIKKSKLIHYTNSLDVTGLKSGYFVGYASIGFWKNGS